jgi:hypothetical protein
MSSKCGVNIQDHNILLLFVFNAILQEATLVALLSSRLASSILESCKACIQSTRVTT